MSAFAVIGLYAVKQLSHEFVNFVDTRPTLQSQRNFSCQKFVKQSVMTYAKCFRCQRRRILILFAERRLELADTYPEGCKGKLRGEARSYGAQYVSRVF